MSEVYDLKFFAPVIVASDVGTSTIKSFFTTHNLNIDGGNTVKNGSIYNIILSDDYSLTDVVTIGTTGSELKLGNGDWLVVRDSYNTPFVSLDVLSTVGENANLYVIKAGTSVYEIYALSTALSTEVDNLNTTLNTEVHNLYTALNTEIKDLSTALSTEIKDLSTALSTDVDNLSTALSTEVDNLYITLSTEVNNLYTALNTEIKDLSTALSTDVDNLSTALSTEIQTLSTSLSNTVD